MWKKKVVVMLMVVGVLGAIPNDLKKYLYTLGMFL